MNPNIMYHNTNNDNPIHSDVNPKYNNDEFNGGFDATTIINIIKNIIPINGSIHENITSNLHNITLFGKFNSACFCLNINTAFVI